MTLIALGLAAVGVTCLLLAAVCWGVERQHGRRWEVVGRG